MAEDVQSLMREAESAMGQKDWDKAIEFYQSAMTEDPTNEEACSKLAELFAIRGLISNVIETYFTLMDILDQKGEHELAVEVARWIMKLQPENDKARMKTILIYKEKGNMEEVVKQSLQLARLYIELGQGDQSILLLKNAQEIAPDNLDIGLELAEMYISHGHIPEGTAQYKKIANAYMAKGDREKATEAFRRMKIVQPDDPNLLFTLGNLYMELGKLNEAEGEFRAILRHNLNHTDALMSLGNVCQRKGQFRDAILAFNKILSVNPENEIAKERLGELYQAQGATSEAVKFFLQAASTYQFDENIDRAIKLYQRVLAMDPTNPTACRELTNMGAPLTPEEGMEEEIYAPSIASMEVDEDELELEGATLEEVSGAVVPPTAVSIPDSVEAHDEEDDSRKGKIKRKKERVLPQAPKFKGDVTKFKSDVGSDLTYGGGRRDDTDLKFEAEDEDTGSRLSRKPRGRRSRDLKKKIGKTSGRGLVKKGLLKKPESSKLKTGGLLSSRSKPALPKKGLISRRSTEKLSPVREADEEYDEHEMEQEEMEQEVDEISEYDEMEAAEEEYDEAIESGELEELAEEEIGASEELAYEESEELEEPEYASESLEMEEQHEVAYEEEGYQQGYYEEPSLEEEMVEEYGSENLEAQLGEEDYMMGLEEETPSELLEEEIAEAPEIQQMPSFEDEMPSFEDEMPSFEEEMPSFGDEEAMGFEEMPEDEGEYHPSFPDDEDEEMPEMAELPDMPEMAEMPDLESMHELPEMPDETEIPEAMGLPYEESSEEDTHKAVSLGGGKRKGLLSKKKKSLREALKIEVPEGEALEEMPDMPLMPDLAEEEEGLHGMAELPEFGELPEMTGIPEMAELPDMSEGMSDLSYMTGLPEEQEEEGFELSAMPEMPSFEEDENFTLDEGHLRFDEMAELPEEEEMAAELPGLEEFESPETEPEIYAEEIPEPVSEYPESIYEDMELPDLDMESMDMEFGSDAIEETPEIGELPGLQETMMEEGTAVPEAITETGREEKVSDFDIDLELPDLDFEAKDMFDIGGDLSAFEPAATKRLDMDDFASSLMKLADEIEMIIPDEDRLLEVEESAQKSSADELPVFEEEAEEVETMPQPTRFLELPELMSEEISMDVLPPMPDELEEPITEQAPELPKVSAETVFLPPLEDLAETPVPPTILEEVEVAPELEIEEKEEIEEIPEEIPEEPSVDLVGKVHELIEESDLGEAFPLFEEVLKDKADDMELRREHAELCYKYGKVDEAINSYKVLLEKESDILNIRKTIIRGQLLKNYNDDAVVSLLEYGNDLTANDKVEDAQRVFQYVLALQKENPQAREALSEIYLNMDMKELALYHLNILADYMEEKSEIENAISVLKKIFTLTSSLKTQEKLADVYIQNNLTEEAIAELTNLARKYKEKGQLDKAAGNYEKIIGMEPKRMEAHEELIDLLQKLGQTDKFYTEKVLVANLMVEKDMLKEAQDRYEECLKIRNTDNEVRRVLVDIYLKNNKFQNALDEAKILSQAYHKERRYEEAIVLYNQLIENDPRNLALREKLSEFYVMSDQLQKGLDQLIIVAEELSARNEWDGAIKAYKKALTIDNKNADLHYRIGEIFLNQKNNTTEARFEFAKVFELDPTHRKAMEHLIKLYLSVDKPSDAVRVLKKLIELDKSYKSMEKDIMDEFKQKIKDNPNDFKAHFNLGMVYKELEMWTKAIEQFQQTRKSNDYVLESHGMLGVCFFQQPPMRNLAVKTLEKGLRLKGFKPEEYIDLHYQLGILYNSMGKSKKAVKEMEAVLKIDPHYKDTAEILESIK